MSYSTMGQVVLVGAGNMGGAMLSGWLKSGVPGSSVTVIDPGPSEVMLKQIADAGARYTSQAPDGLKADILFLALKPQVMEAVLPGLKSLVGPQTVVVSVAAGKT
ncbi:MAG: NAD(P)-binding domain-containing protein, partial [Rhizobium sp.]|nr:NAD(P)-binding domain-containing protein [Rhizobium sp.]